MAQGRRELPLGKKLVFATVVVVGFFVLLELALATAGVEPTDVEEDPYVGFDAYAPLFERDDASGELRTARNKLEWFNDQRFAAEKPPGTFRIFAVGGSTTYGRPYDHQVSFSRWLELLLDQMDLARDYQVINAGGISYASYRLVVLMRELVDYEPDLFIIYTGHNEFLEERTYRELIDDGPVTRTLRRGASKLRTAALLHDLLIPEPERDELSAEVQAKLDVWSGLAAFERDDELRASVTEHFRFNVRQMIEIARASGVSIVFVEPASNIKDFSPFKSEHASGVDVERFDQVYGEAKRYPAGEECGRAVPLLEKALALSPEFATVHYRLGRCLLTEGKTARAGEHLIRAKELDVAPLRALETIQETIREVTREEGVALVPARTLLESDSQKRYGHPLLGSEYFLDHVHPRVEVHQRIAEWIVEELDTVSVVLTKEQREALYARFLDTLDASYFARRDLNLGKVLGWAEKNAEAAEAFERALVSMPNEPELLRNLGIVYQKQHRYEAAIEKYLALAELRPNDPEVHFNLGKCYQGMRAWDDAAKSFEKALELEPGDGKSHYNLALTLRALGRYQDELVALENAWRADPDISGIAALLGTVYAREERFGEAIAAFEASLESEPGVGSVHYHLGSLYAASGERQRALEHFRRAMALGVDVPPIVFEELGAKASETTEGFR
jgi:tetratricopeptide (TPR) repeat protein